MSDERMREVSINLGRRVPNVREMRQKPASIFGFLRPADQRVIVVSNRAVGNIGLDDMAVGRRAHEMTAKPQTP